MGRQRYGFSYLLVLVSILLVSIVGYYAYSRIDSGNPVIAPSTIITPELKDTKSSFSFTAAGDFSSSDEADLVLKGISDSKSAFTLALGDLGYGGNGTEQAWCDFVTTRVGDSHPFQIVAGNHDDGSRDGDIAEYAKCLPNKIDNVIGEYGIEYYFDYGDIARFIMISPDINNYGFDYESGSEHLQWVVDRVNDARTEGIEWVVLGMHKNCITPGVKSCEIGEDLLNTAVDKGVDIVLQGHEHAYFRSKQLKLSAECPAILVNDFSQECVSDSDNSVKKGNGTVVVISGAGGYSLRDLDTGDPEYNYFAAVNAKNSGNSHGFSFFEVSNDTINALFIPVTGNFTDSFTISR